MAGLAFRHAQRQQSALVNLSAGSDYYSHPCGCMALDVVMDAYSGTSF